MGMPTVNHDRKIKPREPMAIALGESLKETRVAAGWTQDRVSEVLGVTKQTVSGWENGRNIPSTLVLMRLCQLYNASADSIFGGARRTVKEVFKRPPKPPVKK